MTTDAIFRNASQTKAVVSVATMMRIEDGKINLLDPITAVPPGTAGYGWYTADRTEPICSTMDRPGTVPLSQQPGPTCVYGFRPDILIKGPCGDKSAKL